MYLVPGLGCREMLYILPGLGCREVPALVGTVTKPAALSDPSSPVSVILMWLPWGEQCLLVH